MGRSQTSRRNEYRNRVPIDSGTLGKSIQQLESFFDPSGSAASYTVPVGFGIQYAEGVAAWIAFIAEYRRLRVQAGDQRTAILAFERMLAQPSRLVCRKRLIPLVRLVLTQRRH